MNAALTAEILVRVGRRSGPRLMGREPPELHLGPTAAVGKNWNGEHRIASQSRLTMVEAVRRRTLSL